MNCPAAQMDLDCPHRVSFDPVCMINVAQYPEGVPCHIGYTLTCSKLFSFTSQTPKNFRLQKAFIDVFLGMSKELGTSITGSVNDFPVILETRALESRGYYVVHPSFYLLSINGHVPL